MPYNKKLDERIGGIVKGRGVTRKNMFGGTCHLLNGNMMCGVYKDFLILRLGEAEAAKALAKPHVKPFDITGRPMKGWVMVEEPGFQGPALEEWLEKARRFARTLPAK